jgi:hypothetical protein
MACPIQARWICHSGGVLESVRLPVFFDLSLFESSWTSCHRDPDVERFENEVLYYVDRMEPYDWVMVLAVVIVVGFVCMKGMGSRLNG